MSPEFRLASRPTMYFIGVTTAQSSINRVFPHWAERLQLGECELRGIDFVLHDRPERYREAIDFIRNDPLSRGALVTSHKIDLFNACVDQFDVLDPLTRSLGEVSSVFKRGDRLHGRTVDPLTCGYALGAFLPPHHWSSGAEALILGAGGAGTAIAWHLCHREDIQDRPDHIQIMDPIAARLEHLKGLHATWATKTKLNAHQLAHSGVTSEVLRQLPAGSLIVNATGLGKDAPGSPLPADAVFPERGMVWELNYRGELLFLQQARAQQSSRQLQIEDGWRYFLHGWTRVIADVFQRDIPIGGSLFEELGKIAAAVRE